MSEQKLKNIQEKIKIKFSDKSLLKEALTHRSYINELDDSKKRKGKHNERLEFLGDAVLEIIVTEYLFNNFPDKPEGVLTSYRAALVNTQSISMAGGEIGIDKFMYMSMGESKDVGRAREKILANAFEAIIGAIYMDKGYDVAKDFISKNLLVYLEEILSKKLWLDSKSHFQEVVQEKTGITPSYKIISEEGPDHDKIFSTAVYIGEEKISEGKGRSKQEAEQEAAKNAIEDKRWG